MAGQGPELTQEPDCNAWVALPNSRRSKPFLLLYKQPFRFMTERIARRRRLKLNQTKGLTRTSAAQGKIESFEQQLQNDLGVCLNTNLSRIEIVGSEPRKQVARPARHRVGRRS
jgi:hypothetical protein